MMGQVATTTMVAQIMAGKKGAYNPKACDDQDSDQKHRHHGSHKVSALEN
jgi:hypothetical protein